MKEFSALSREALGWYVYLLSDSKDEVFYVGKGVANRAFAHGADARELHDHPELQSAKAERILAIEALGETVRVQVLRHGISSERQAYEVESAAIDLINALAPGNLLNIVLGHHHAQHGLMVAEEVEILYAAKEAPLLRVPVILVSLNKLWRPDMTAAELYESTHGWWNARGARRDQAQYVMGVHNGVVRSVYRPTTWRPRVVGDPDWQDDIGKSARWGFEGVPAPEMEQYLRTSVARYLTSKQWSHRYVGPD